MQSYGCYTVRDVFSPGKLTTAACIQTDPALPVREVPGVRSQLQPGGRPLLPPPAAPPRAPANRGQAVELQTKVHTKVRRNHREVRYKGLLLVESGYNLHIKHTINSVSVS